MACRKVRVGLGLIFCNHESSWDSVILIRNCLLFNLCFAKFCSSQWWNTKARWMRLVKLSGKLDIDMRFIIF